MQTIKVRVTVALLAFTAGVLINQLVNTSPLVEYTLTYLVRSVGTISLPKAAGVNSAAFNNLPTQIIVKRVYSGCTDCGSREIVMRTTGLSEFEDATVTETDFHAQQRCGTLASGYYEDLIKLIESQGYFEKAQRYDMQWNGGTPVTSTVAMRRPIVTASAGEIPTRVWGLGDVIEDVSAKINWDDGDCAP
jgi:hypothetical protein